MNLKLIACHGILGEGIDQGIVDWNEFFKAAEKCGVKNYFVEMEPETFKDSANYILKL